MDPKEHGMNEVKSLPVGSVISTLVTVGIMVFDLVEDLIVMGTYWTDDDMRFFYMTLLFVAVPSIAMMILSIIWYWKDHHKYPASPVAINARALFLILQLGPVLRCIEALILKYKSGQNPRDKDLEEHFHKEERRAHFLRLLEGFLECGPQLILQLYIILQEWELGDHHNHTTFSRIMRAILVVHLLVSMSEAIVMHNTVLRAVQSKKRKQRLAGIACQFLWYTCVLWARISSLALFASIGNHFQMYTAIVCCAHWVIMLIWILRQHKHVTHKDIEGFASNYLYCMSMAVIYVFTFFRVSEGKTVAKYAAYYICVFVESSIMVVVWYLKSSDTLWYRNGCMSAYFVTFAVGVAAMVVYYMFLHPSKKYIPSEHYSLAERDTRVDETMLSEARMLADNGGQQDLRA